ncbi:hypothetical protein [Bacillus sp. UNC438CL73TsuS30]|uniref:hypothetical protein n=1 Tax=Bacillus sp. UNC438CL73TsuS30 TaxID=1340434 RepID=UPI00047B1A94|nr:hypothetical protein [Bacillus sp. UNC438CL73TsuS30]
MAKIAPKGNRYYIKHKFMDLGNVYNDGAIYDLTQEQAEYHADKIENVSFPALEKIELDIDQEVVSYKQQRDQIRTSTRYNDNESERKFQLQDLREKLDAKIQDLRTKYEENVQLIQADLAKKSTQLAVKPEAAAQAADMLSILGTQLAFSANQADVLALFGQQIAAVGDDVKAALFVKFGSVLPAVNDEAKQQLSSIYSQLEAAHPGIREFKTKIAHLSALTSSYNPTSPYKLMNLMEGREGR